MKPNTTEQFESYLIDKLKSKKEAKAYLKVALEEYEQDGDADFFMAALRNVAEAQGGMSSLARKTDLNRSNLYKALSPKGNPRFVTLDTILRALGFRLSIEMV